MLIETSSAIKEALPDIEHWVKRAARQAARHDPHIQIDDIFVRVRRHPRSDWWSGCAWPDKISYHRGYAYHHKGGRINLSVGVLASKAEVIWLMLHELRHLGQFKRGHEAWKMESDADSFANQMSKRMRLGWYRDLGVALAPTESR